MRRIRMLLVVSFVVVGTLAPMTGLGAAGIAAPSAGSSTAAECSYPITETDATGTDVTLEDEPETVVTLTPSPAQTIWDIGADEKVIGLTKHAENLEGAEERTSVSTEAETIQPEVVVDLEPDLVLATDTSYVSEETIETLREAGLTVYYIPEATSLEEVRDRTQLIGSLVGACDGAAETVDWMDEELAVVDAAIDGEDQPDVLYTFFGYTAGSGTFVHDVIEAAGGTNVAAEAGVEGYHELNDEVVIDSDPDWIITNTNSPEVPETPAYQSTTAVQNDQTVTININELNRPGPRTVDAVTELADTFHPDAYAAAVDDAETSAETDESDDESDGDELPGFGVGAVVIAALLFVMATLQRTSRS
ncbi:PGF-CTERM-anchored ABC transporter substrate-binding protein [Natronorubrum sulfidifaciens]|nr:PGF-CTERM-anchored ABC transporter substrate-binding protein [Natronorubrum sulfidifaciens]